MTGFNHVATGAIIALVVKQPLMALPLALASHFVLDALPHYGVEYAERNNYPSFRRIIGTDSVVTPVFIVAMFLITHSWLVFAAMLVAISPDFVWFTKYGYDKAKKREFSLPTDAFSRVHKRIQWGERTWGWMLELIWLVVALSILHRLV